MRISEDRVAMNEAAYLQYLQSCKSCWWQEGGRCFLPGTFKRLPNGNSSKLANELCESHKSKRSVLSPLLGDVKLIIISEENARQRDVGVT